MGRPDEKAERGPRGRGGRARVLIVRGGRSFPAVRRALALAFLALALPGIAFPGISVPGVASPATARPEGPRFVGSNRCRTCHFAEHKSWVETRMAKAFDLLKPGAAAEAKKKAGLDPAKDYTADAACLPCHATGYGRPGGFVSAAATPALVGVQCEACHGAGGEYLKEGKMTLANRQYRRADLVAAGMVLQSAATCAALCHNDGSPTHRLLYYAQGVKAEVHKLVPLKLPHE